VKAGGVGHDASKVRVYGDGVKATGVLASLPVSFTVDTSQAGVADVDILIEVCGLCFYLLREIGHRCKNVFTFFTLFTLFCIFNVF